MDPNNTQNSSTQPPATQNSSNYPFQYQNPNNYQHQNQSSNQQYPQNIPNYGFAPNFSMPSCVPNYHPYFRSMPYSAQPPSYYPSPLMENENVRNVRPTEFPAFSTQMALGGVTGDNEATPRSEDSMPLRKKHAKWTIEQNLVLLSGWIKYGTDSVIGRNQKSEAYWGKIAEYCNEHCSFDHPRDGVACRNHYNYINKVLGKWIGAYDTATRMRASGWSENDVLAKAHEVYSSGKNGHFNLMSEWLAVRDQPRYRSQVGGNTGSESSGSKRSHEGVASDSNSVASSARPMGRDASKKKGKRTGKAPILEEVNEEWSSFKQMKEKELEQLSKIAIQQEQTNQLLREKTYAKKMKMYLKLSEKEHLDDRAKSCSKS